MQPRTEEARWANGKVSINFALLQIEDTDSPLSHGISCSIYHGSKQNNNATLITNHCKNLRFQLNIFHELRPEQELRKIWVPAETNPSEPSSSASLYILRPNWNQVQTQSLDCTDRGRLVFPCCPFTRTAN